MNDFKKLENNNEQSENSDKNKIFEFIKYLTNTNLKKELEENNIINEEEENDEINILQKFIEDPNILKNQSDLILFIKELENLINTENNILFPFLDICPILVKSYIESDLDEDDSDYENNKIFKLLKINSFISREYLFPIYEYFSDIYYNIKKIEENEPKIKKFNKVFELWKIFYDFDEKDIKDINSSSYCFIGGSLKVNLSEEISLENYSFTIRINFLKIYFNINENSFIFKTEDKIPFKIKFSQIENILKEEKPISIFIKFDLKEIIIKLEDKDEDKKKDEENNLNSFEIKMNHNISNIKDFYLLENFYGQIKSLEIIIIKKDNNNNIHEIFEPYPLPDNGFLYHRNNNKKNIKNEQLEYYNDNKNNNNDIISINVINKKLVKANYINYLDNNLDLIEYLGGFNNFIPFIPLINEIYKKEKIKTLNNIDLNKIIEDILNLFSKILIKYQNKYSLYFQKYSLFVSSLILQIDFELFRNENVTKNKEEMSKSNQFYGYLLNLNINPNSLIFYIFGKIFNNTKDEFIEYISDNLKTEFRKELNKDYIKNKIPIVIMSSYKQLFRHLIKELFIYNRFWSNKDFFFIKKNNNQNSEFDLYLKYKQISYYTQSFQQPLLYPILEFDEYIPSFSRFNKDNIFKPEFNKTINYNFNFQNNIINEIIEKNNPINEEKNKIKCCLIKKNYHVKGEIFIIKRKIDNNTIKNKKNNNNDKNKINNNINNTINNKNNDNEIIKNNDNKNNKFNIVFCSDKDNDGQTCNKNPKKNSNKKINIINSNNDKICYGSSFPAINKEFNRKILIQSKDIKFLLIRNYYRRTSAIEIFTYNSNKSYYFNFHEIINLNDPSNNIILKEIVNNKCFKKLSFSKEINVYYNKKYRGTMFPLFFDNYPSWEKKVKFYTNYELLTIINLLSNRSFKDLYQYPIFPILYKPNNILDNEKYKERDLGQHLGIQALNNKSKDRKELIEDSYMASIESQKNGEGGEKPCLFNTHYSNPVYVSNYLLRIFPYSFSGIELQGDGFDNPNRLFYSIKKTMENTLSQKSDLREMLPELYYFPDLFFNNNDLNLGHLTNGQDIDSITVKEKIKDQKEEPYVLYEYLSKFQNYFEFEHLKLNKWIDLIFGINQRTTKDNKDYYENDMYIHFDEEQQNKDITDDIVLQKLEFGIQPFQLLDKKFPYLKYDSQYYKDLKEFNIDQYIKQHSIIKGDKKKCFKYEGYNNKNPVYIDIIKKNIKYSQKKGNELELEEYFKDKDYSITFFNYIFIGDVLGNIIIYKNNKEFHNKSKQIINDNIHKNNNKFKKIKILTDHYKQIKYIDYNPRLNLFLSYSLDGFINIYVFPKCKLVRTIKVCNITDSNDILKKVVLVSTPFPMIFTYDSINMYLFTLNGELINKKELIIKNMKLYPCIDKDCGLVNDCIFYENLNEKKKIERKEILFPSLLPVN